MIRTRRAPLACGLLLACLVVGPGLARPAWANGAYSHIHISQLAVQELPPGPLLDLLSDPALVPIYEAGSMFPDSGYAASDEYGETAHWAPFHNGYVRWLREHHGDAMDSPAAREHAAFLLGVMSHGLADQIYDTTLLERAFELDGPGEADMLADYFIVVDNNVLIYTEAWAPYPELVEIFDSSVGYGVSEATLQRGMDLMELVLGFQRAAARPSYLETWQQFPWLGTHIYNPAAAGSLPHLATLVAAHWQAVYERLQGGASMDEHLLVASIPPDGGVNFPVDDSDGDPYRRVGLVLGYSVRRSQVAPLLRLLDASGDPVPVRLRTAYGGEIRNFLMLEPVGTLDYDSEYRVELAPGVENLDGEVSTVAYELRFRTRCAPEQLEACPPLPPPLVAAEIPLEVPPEPDPPGEDAGVSDVGVADAGASDGGALDAGATDGGPGDAGGLDPRPDTGPPAGDGGADGGALPDAEASRDGDTAEDAGLSVDAASDAEPGVVPPSTDLDDDDDGCGACRIPGVAGPDRGWAARAASLLTVLLRR